MSKKITIQENHQALQTSSEVLILDVQSDSQPTQPLLHKQSRFLYILEGEGKIKIEDNVYELHPNTVISMLPWQVSEIIEVTKQLTYYLLVFDFNMMNLYFKNEMNVNSDNTEVIHSLYHNNIAVYDPKVCEKFLNIFEDIREEVGIISLNLDTAAPAKRFQTIYLISKLSELIVIYLRYLEGHHVNDAKDSPVESIFFYMFLNSSKDLNLKLLSKVFLKSESYISKYICEVTGLKLNDFLDEIRMYKANHLLRHTNMTLKDIARYLNYSDPAVLTRKFNENYNMGTKAYKRAANVEEKLLDIRFDERSTKILNYVYENYQEDIDINTVAEIFDTNPRMINGIVRYYLESDFYSFLNQVRIRKACDLLVETTFPIMEIALMVGYNTTKTFNRNFTKILTMNPQQFRETYQKENN